MKNALKLSLLAATIAASGMAHAENAKIAFLGGFTGPLESLTPPIYAGAKLAVDQINAQGGSIELLKGDSTCADATAASNVADRMVNSEKVIGIVGPMCSGATIAAANNAAIPGGVPLISPSATSPALTDLNDNDLVYRTAPSDAYQGEMNRHFKTSYHMPILFFTQLMGLAFGASAGEVGVGSEVVSAADALARIGIEVPPAEPPGDAQVRPGRGSRRTSSLPMPPPLPDQELRP